MSLLAGTASLIPGQGTGLAGEFYTALVPSVCSPNAATVALCNAIAAVVVAHITANAVVVPTALLAPPGTAGGPVTGTGTIT